MNTHHPALTHLYPADFEAGQATSGTPLPQDLVLELFDYVEEGLAITGCDQVVIANRSRNSSSICTWPRTFADSLIFALKSAHIVG